MSSCLTLRKSTSPPCEQACERRCKGNGAFLGLHVFLPGFKCAPSAAGICYTWVMCSQTCNCESPSSWTLPCSYKIICIYCMWKEAVSHSCLHMYICVRWMGFFSFTHTLHTTYWTRKVTRFCLSDSPQVARLVIFRSVQLIWQPVPPLGKEHNRSSSLKNFDVATYRQRKE